MLATGKYPVSMYLAIDCLVAMVELQNETIHGLDCE